MTKRQKKVEAKEKKAAAKKKKAAAKKVTLKRHTRAGPPPHIGFLVGTTYAAWEDYIKAFENELMTDYNWKKGDDYTVEYQPAAGQQYFYGQIAADFTKPKRTPPIDIIVTGGTAPTASCISTNTTIPIVFATAGDVDTLMASSKGNNVCGISNDQAAHAGARLKHMKKHLGKLGKIGLISNAAAAATNVGKEIAAVVAQAQGLGLSVYQPKTATLNTVEDINPVIQDLIKNYQVEALYVCTDPFITSNADILNEWAQLAGLSTMHAFGQNCGQRGTLFWGPKLEDMFSTAAKFVYQILNNVQTPAQIGVVSPAYPGSFESQPPGL